MIAMGYLEKEPVAFCRHLLFNITKNNEDKAFE
jgi:hypothetical protein